MTTNDGTDVRAGIRWLLLRRLVSLADEERRLVQLLARKAVELVKARAVFAAERGDPSGPPWPVPSMQEFGASVAPRCLLSLRDRLRRVRALLDGLVPAQTPVDAWLFWDERCGGLGPMTEMAVSADAAGLVGSAAWLDTAAPEGGVNRYLLREGGVSASAASVWSSGGVRWQDRSQAQARFAFEMYAAACAAWQALLDWDLRVRTADASHCQLDAAVAERLGALEDTLAALRHDCRPALSAAGGRPESEPAAQRCPLLEYATSLVAGVAEIGRRATSGEDPAVLARLANDLSAAMCVCIMGPPGTGKTRAARRAARLYFGLGLLLSADYRELGRADLVGGYIGETEERTRAALEACVEGFVLIDEAYALAGTGKNGADGRHKQGAGDDFGPVALAVLVQFLTAPETTGRVAVWAAGYRSAMERDFLGANQGVPSRFPVKLDWPALTPHQLAGIVVRTLATSPSPSPSPVPLGPVVAYFADRCRRRSKPTARDAEFLARRALRLARDTGLERAVSSVFT